MKKYFVMLVMLFTMSVYSYAEDTNTNEVNNVEKYDINVDIKKLGSFLQLTSDQEDGMKTVEVELHNDLLVASVETNDESRAKITKNAIEKHIKHAHYVLNDEQYHKYLRVLNVTLVNRGIVK